MTPEELHRRAGELFEQALELPDEDLPAFLDLQCGTDSVLRQRVEALVQAERNAPGGFLNAPAMQVAARLLQMSGMGQPGTGEPALTGTQVGNYRIGESIGAGGMGTVYEAFDLRLSRKVAIKILPPAFASDPDRVRRFQQESRAVSLLNHPNIVSIYDADRDQGHYYIATEFVEGQTLRQLAGGRPLDLKLLFDVAVQVATALDAAHNAGIVHRDIKPENLMRRPDGFVKVLDFGLAKLGGGESEASFTQTGSVAGTVHYVSPEQVLGEPAGPRSDLFSLGIVLYELATGVRPFRGQTAGAVFNAILHSDPAPPSSLHPVLDPEFDAVVLRLLEKDPEYRFQTASDLRSALRRLARGGLSTSGIAGPSSSDSSVTVEAGRTGRFSTGVWMAGALAATLVVLMVGSAVLLRARWPAILAGSTRNLPAHFDRLTDIAGEETFPALFPDGNQFVFSSAQDGDWDIYLQRTGGSKAINLTADSDVDDTQAAVSPDGLRIAFRSERDGGGLFVMEATGENPRRIAQTGYLPAWSPDGTQIVSSSRSFTVASERGAFSELRIHNLRTGQEQALPSGLDAIQPHWSPNGHRIAFWGLASGGQRDIFTVSAKGDGPPVPVTSDPAIDWNPVWAPEGDRLYFLSNRGGLMNLWRVAIDERSGKLRGEPEPVTTPSASMGFLSFAADGQRFVFAQVQSVSNLFAVRYDAARQQVLGEEQMVGNRSQWIANFSFSPDEQRLVIDTLGDTQEDLWIANRDGSGRRRLTSDAYKDRSPSWSPDGEEIVFFSDRSGRYEIWAIRSDGSGLRKVTETTGPELQSPEFMGNGRYVFAPRQSLVPGAVDLSGPLPVKEFLPLHGLTFPGRRLFVYKWLPDAEIVAGESQEDGTATQLLLYYPKQQRTDLLGVNGTVPLMVPGRREVLFTRDNQLLLFDCQTRREKLVHTFPQRIGNSMQITRDGWIYFSRRERDSDLWIARMGQ